METLIGLLKNNQPIIAPLTPHRKLREISLDNTRAKARARPRPETEELSLRYQVVS